MRLISLSVFSFLLFSIYNLAEAYSPKEEKCYPDNYEMRFPEANYVIAAKFIRFLEITKGTDTLGEFKVLYTWKGDLAHNSHIQVYTKQKEKFPLPAGVPYSEAQKLYLLLLKKDSGSQAEFIGATCMPQIGLRSLEITNERIIRINNYFLGGKR